uniref:Uncharacterized protein n=1 Tax=Anguilla anguilla TaxID=7936 RepID=A0A0E9R343_ANGAN
MCHTQKRCPINSETHINKHLAGAQGRPLC